MNAEKIILGPNALEGLAAEVPDTVDRLCHIIRTDRDKHNVLQAIFAVRSIFDDQVIEALNEATWHCHRGRLDYKVQTVAFEALRQVLAGAAATVKPEKLENYVNFALGSFTNPHYKTVLFRRMSERITQTAIAKELDVSSSWVSRIERHAARDVFSNVHSQACKDGFSYMVALKIAANARDFVEGSIKRANVPQPKFLN